MARRGWATGAVRGIAAVLALAIPATAAAVEVRYEADLFSHYVWRGITLTDGPVFQPGVGIAHDSGFSLELWGNVDLSDDNDLAGEVNETRIVVDYGRRLGDFEIGAGAIEYLFPNSPFPGTREVYLRVGLDARVSPRLEVFYDVDEIQGAYARLSLAYQRNLAADWRCALEVAAGYSDAEFAIGRKAGLHDAGVELRLERSAGPLDLRLRTGWTGSLDPEVLPDQPTSLWAGVSIAARL
jgi:uncharacterized protein (TIGR02001 family)